MDKGRSELKFCKFLFFSRCNLIKLLRVSSCKTAQIAYVAQVLKRTHTQVENITQMLRSTEIWHCKQFGERKKYLKSSKS